MGLFSRTKDEPTKPPVVAAGKSFGHAAFDRADIDDARRGHPAVSLAPFATANGLAYSNNEVYGGFLSTLPVWPDYIFNVCRGELGGRLTQVCHELLELEASEGSIRGGGTFYDVRVTTRRSLGEMMNLGTGDPQNAPFAGNAVWIPTTTVHIRTPELNQLPTFRVGANRKVNDAYAAACQPLAGRGDAYVRLQVKYGIVALTVNGYRCDEADLQHLINTAAHIAHNLVAMTQPASTAFTTPGAPAGHRPPAGVPIPHPNYTPAYATAAGELGLFNEDAHSLAHVLPRCPIPGIASGVLFGTLPGTQAVGRMVWFEHGGITSGTVRGGVIVSATPGATTPMGGAIHEPTGMRVEAVDGIAYCWKIKRFAGRLESAQLTADARMALAATGAAAL